MITTDSAFLISSFGNNVHLYKSNQLGWEEKNAVGFDFFKIGDVLFSQDFYNIHRSMDNVETWEMLPIYGDSFFRGTSTASRVIVIHSSPSSQDTCAGGGLWNYHLFKSSDNGVNFQELDSIIG